MRVLIIEDYAMLAMQFEMVAQDAGHDVTCIAGVVGKPDEFVGIGEGGKTPIDLSQFDAAAVDGQLIGDLAGWELVPQLVKAGIYCIGISGDHTSNGKMLAAGADYAMDKGRVYDLNGTLEQIAAIIASKGRKLAGNPEDSKAA